MAGVFEEALSEAAARPPATVIAREALSLENGCKGFLAGVSALSPFLKRLMTREPTRLQRVLSSDPARGFSSLIGTYPDDLSTGEVKSRLRETRNDLALAIALADLSGIYDLDSVIAALSSFADFSVRIALRTGVRDAAGQRGVVFETDNKGLPYCGIGILAMGKHGSQELNYSSDIDLIAIYDPERSGLSVKSRLDAKAFSIKAVHGMVAILSDQTPEGFVFRTDLRLRPNPGATGIVVSLTAAERYYEAYGQNWERAAFIKARGIAGDDQVLSTFLDMMRPFVWRRSLDFDAVADIFAVKQQIHAQKGSPDLQVRGADIKTGPGGIREIEFYAQTQQLLLGGRDLALRTPTTEDALDALATAGHVPHAVADRLTRVYRKLRDVEHRLQMQEDRQTQTLPEADGDLARMATMMGVDDADAFERDLLDDLHFVHDTYAELFSAPQPTSPVPGNLVFTGVEDDPRTIATLKRMGFSDPSLVTASVRRWHQGGIRPTRSVRARELLTALVPKMLMVVSKSPDPNSAFLALDRFLKELPTGLQIFSLFHSSPRALDDLLVLCQTAPDLVRQLGERPRLIEVFLTDLDLAPPEFPSVSGATAFELRLDEVRLIVNEHRTQCAAATALERADAIEVGRALADTAAGAIANLTDAIRVERHAMHADGIALSVLAFGRLGARALTTRSDLDLVFVYDIDPNAPGEARDMTRLVRRIVSALSVTTAAGPLYEIDMALRPSGGAGPTAVSLAAFDKYYRQKAWIWEKMALLKARVVYGDDEISERLRQSVVHAIRPPLHPEDVRSAVVEMRERLLREKRPRGDFDVKRLPGGLTDLDFIVSGMILMTDVPDAVLHPKSTQDRIAQLVAANLLSSADAQQLTDAWLVFERFLHFSRIAFGMEPPRTIESGAAQRVAAILGVQKASEIKRLIQHHRGAVDAIFARIMGRALV